MLLRPPRRSLPMLVLQRSLSSVLSLLLRPKPVEFSVIPAVPRVLVLVRLSLVPLRLSVLVEPSVLLELVLKPPSLQLMLLVLPSRLGLPKLSLLLVDLPRSKVLLLELPLVESPLRFLPSFTILVPLLPPMAWPLSLDSSLFLIQACFILTPSVL